jgi:hypothetical protein
MQIISHVEGYMIWHAAWDEVAPTGGISFPLLSTYLQTQFEFQSVSMSQVGQQSGMIMPFAQVGQVSAESGVVPVFNLEFQPDRVILGSTNTDLAIESLAEIISKLSTDLGFRFPDSDRTITYRTSFVFDPEVDLAKLLGPMQAIADRVSTGLLGTGKVQPFGFRFIASQEEAVDQLVVIERRVPCPPDENRWFVQAPFDLGQTTLIVNELIKGA